jgi:hypothetical protein
VLCDTKRPGIVSRCVDPPAWGAYFTTLVYIAYSRRGDPLFNLARGLYPRRAFPNCPGAGPGLDSGATVSWRGEVRDIIAQLEQQGGPEGERLEAQATARLREIEQRIDDLRASLG